MRRLLAEDVMDLLEEVVLGVRGQRKTRQGEGLVAA
jgi:hypothetical protein